MPDERGKEEFTLAPFINWNLQSGIKQPVRSKNNKWAFALSLSPCANTGFILFLFYIFHRVNNWFSGS